MRCDRGGLYEYFNPRSREGSDVYAGFSAALRPRNFNPRSREGSDLHALAIPLFDREFQSTLPRRERLFAGKIKQNPLHISIHAPAKGATGVKGNFGVIIAISIHAPAKGATRGAPLTRRTRWISIHAPAKGATREFAKLDEAEWISIHAPAKGATLSQHSAFRPSPHFNPRSREGSDLSP